MSDGSRLTMYYVEEVTPGTTPTSPALSTLRTSGTTLGLTKDLLESEELRDDRQIATIRLGANQTDGDVNFEFSHTSYDDLLEGAAFETWATNVLKAGVTRKYYTIIRYHADIQTADKPYQIFRGCEVAQMNLEINANSMITGSFNIRGRTVEYATDLTGLGTPTFPAVSTTEPFDSFSGSLLEGGASIACVTGLTLNLNNKLDPNMCVGNADVSDHSAGRSNLTGQLSARFNSSTLLEKFKNETESSLEVVLTDPDAATMTVEIPRLVYTGGRADVTNENAIIQVLPFQALLDDTEASNLKLTRSA